MNNKYDYQLVHYVKDIDEIKFAIEQLNKYSADFLVKQINGKGWTILVNTENLELDKGGFYARGIYGE